MSYTSCMDLQQHVPLSQHSTMRLGGTATYSLEVSSRGDLVAAVEFAEAHNLPIIMIGDGSNIIWRDEGFNGLVIVNKIMRFEDFDEDGTNHYITVGAGENWDSAVARSVAAGLTGIEALSLIPGTAGATPVQNVGAYGQEVASTLVSVEAYDTVARTFVNIPASECEFAYRTSRFKTTDKGRFFITAITLHLTRGNPEPPFYADVAAYLQQHNVSNVTPAVIREAVIAIRSAKLPDPAQVANNGSFFGNPIVDAGTFAQIVATYPDIPHWDTSDGRVKLAAAWLVEQAGFIRGFHDTETGMCTWKSQALVLVNEHATSTADLLKFKQKIVDAVRTKFGVTLEQEPELLP